LSLINGISSLGNGFAALARNAATDADAPASASLLNSTPDTPAPADTAASTPVPPGPRMPPGANPYGDNPHAQALWAAEQAIKGPESGGNASAQNPTSSAGGLFQITNDTWDAALQKLGVPAPSSDTERNAQKYNPDMNTAVMRSINTDAAAALDAKSLPVTVETLQAAHRLGPGGAAEAIQAAMKDPDAPLVGNGLSPNAVKGNGDISKLTVGQFLASPYPNARNQGGT
jgi:hypothetical protein